uniref:uncharacterized protein si:dkey-13e3.1 n=1 Tax=Epinephelus lanceolatus TaxID=310571 RepID=UPI00144712CF
MESTIGKACFELIERIAQSKGKCITVADLYVVPTWRQPMAADPLSSLPKPFPVNISWTVARDHWFGNPGNSIYHIQPYGNDCGIFMLMYALYSVLDAPYD